MSAQTTGRRGGPMPCIFVHAGAGFHSRENEEAHLRACEDACKNAMAILKVGGTAVDAVEMAVKILEDREITNAGFGSNPNIDGVVECDAILVDHLGRSGAVGAVAQVKNPISLARVLLDCTSRPLSLRRVPPNLLIGQGATDFAYEHNISVVPHSYMVSPTARHRWQKWRTELMHAEAKARHDIARPQTEEDMDTMFAEQGNPETYRQAHEKAMLRDLHAAMRQLAPITPSPSPSDQTETASGAQSESLGSFLGYDSSQNHDRHSHDHSEGFSDPIGPPGMHDRLVRTPFADNVPQDNRRKSLCEDFVSAASSDNLENVQQDGMARKGGLTSDASFHRPAAQTLQSENLPARTGPSKSLQTQSSGTGCPTPNSKVARSDQVTDTIGAIAIDSQGNIACAASSGGIGMKHRGRVGPAALIGIGAFVISADPTDEEQTSVASVVSGTGEHMATTMAASVCSQRIYHNHRRGSFFRGSLNFEECTEDEALRSFVIKDFLGHPSVENSHTSAAIGTLTIKKTIEGVQLYFGHTTDSFALASMNSDDVKPVSTMSRAPEFGKSGPRLIQGGRMIRWRRRRVR